ncbi:MAG: hypothetical protein A2538_01575 [Candidatus Magasanikbacteria bacterium RIFOXYD2_FULL_41_14]|uniref:HTH arsR-type domain-containing protein n=1 Tax=Candidatus Magasanikbacteria bacterium RIFOXYD2_FULL_41_14 TaxID=1798709 RepID=A0A1F6PDF7_9BACT|nr:MAG: hypothetical protein A2538_01575 [Candidatus Magasanikbacteria bacterium RIFOXYD2_FULL_41_14]
MKTETGNKIVAYLKESGGKTPKELLVYTQISAPALFRQLKKLMARGQITKVGKPPKVLYYYSNHMEPDKTIGNEILDWATTDDNANIKPELLCQTRDVFQARHDRLLNELKKKFNEDLAFTVAAIAGEIGNNSFDHNLGNWRDVMGILFLVDLEKRKIILADRGQGVLSSIKRVRPQTANHADALRIAFTEILSGRFPEQRGNGLKFVAKNIRANNLSLKFYSGDATCEISGIETNFKQSDKLVPGTLTIINF